MPIMHSCPFCQSPLSSIHREDGNSPDGRSRQGHPLQGVNVAGPRPSDYTVQGLWILPSINWILILWKCFRPQCWANWYTYEFSQTTPLPLPAQFHAQPHQPSLQPFQSPHPNYLNINAPVNDQAGASFPQNHGNYQQQSSIVNHESSYGTAAKTGHRTTRKALTVHTKVCETVESGSSPHGTPPSSPGDEPAPWIINEPATVAQGTSQAALPSADTSKGTSSSRNDLANQLPRLVPAPVATHLTIGSAGPPNHPEPSVAGTSGRRRTRARRYTTQVTAEYLQTQPIISRFKGDKARHENFREKRKHGVCTKHKRNKYACRCDIKASNSQPSTNSVSASGSAAHSG